MPEKPNTPAILLLQDGTIFNGLAAGTIGTAGGEICFNTGMTGYQEIYTDPSYFGQIIINTTAHIGNYGTLDQENEADEVMIAGMVCNDFSRSFSREKTDQSLQKYLEHNGITAIQGIDTRKLVRHIRNKGAMNAVISSEITDPAKLKKELDKLPDMSGLELASKVSTKKPYYYGDENAPFKVAVLDIGIKKSILKNLARRGMYCNVFPAKTTFKEMQEFQPDGFFLSNGPGDPSVMNYAVETAKKMIDSKIPVFGICLGHQILAIASGLTTYKMHHGHRGLNHPVKNLITGRGEITSQNHGFSVSPESVEKAADIELTHINLNDNTPEGIRLTGKPVFSVQYHPEASPGPHDSNYLFDDFKALIEKHSNKKIAV